MVLRRRGLSRALPGLALAAVLLTACGDANDDEGPSGTGGSDDPQAAQLAYAKCMRENGVDIPDPKTDDSGGQLGLAPGDGAFAGVDKETFDKAQQACSKHAKDLGGFGPGGLSEEDKQKMVDLARCMREHGVDMPDPDFEGGDGQMGVSLPVDDPDFETASKACNMGAP